jgi:protein-tyrosine-phosphatase
LSQGNKCRSNPASLINPIVVEAIKEVGIDISSGKLKKLDKNMIPEADLTITDGMW